MGRGAWLIAPKRAQNTTFARENPFTFASRTHRDQNAFAKEMSLQNATRASVRMLFVCLVAHSATQRLDRARARFRAQDAQPRRGHGQRVVARQLQPLDRAILGGSIQTQ
jgi:hypothetical protein